MYPKHSEKHFDYRLFSTVSDSNAGEPVQWDAPPAYTEQLPFGLIPDEL